MGVLHNEIFDRIQNVGRGGCAKCRNIGILALIPNFLHGILAVFLNIPLGAAVSNWNIDIISEFPLFPRSISETQKYRNLDLIPLRAAVSNLNIDLISEFPLFTTSISSRVYVFTA